MQLADVEITEPAARALPAGAGVALIGAALMVIGAVGPWIGGHLVTTSSGLDLGGDGWLVVTAAALAVAPVILPLPASGAKGLWAAVCAGAAGYVCWMHYSQATVDGAQVVWGLQIAAAGCVVLGLGGIRLLRPTA